MVALQILVLSVKVRILAFQLELNNNLNILIMILSMYLDTIQIYGRKVNPIDKMILGGNNGR